MLLAGLNKGLVSKDLDKIELYNEFKRNKMLISAKTKYADSIEAIKKYNSYVRIEFKEKD